MPPSIRDVTPNFLYVLLYFVGVFVGARHAVGVRARLRVEGLLAAQAETPRLLNGLRSKRKSGRASCGTLQPAD
jgi:hypothetical protein